MGRYSSDSDSDRKGRSSSKKTKKKSKSRKHRSRSSSYDRRSRDRRSRSRSRSYSSERGKRSRSRGERRNRYRSPRRRRSRSRTDSRDREYSRTKSSRRSRSRSRERSRKKKSKRRSRSRSKEKVKTKDPCEDIPGFADMTPAQQSRLRVQAAFKAAEAATQKESSGKSSPVEVETALDQMEKAQVLNDIGEEGFVPSYFKSSRSAKAKEAQKVSSWPTDLIDQESFHEMAIFGGSHVLGLDEKSKKEISEATDKLTMRKQTISWDKRDPKTLAHPNLDITFEEAERRWLDKLKVMRIEKAKDRGL